MRYYFAGHERWSWFFNTPNQLGLMAGCAIFLGLALYIHGGMRIKLFSILLLFMSTLVLVKTYSRGSWVAFGLVLFVSMMLCPNSLVRGFKTYVLSLLLVAVMMPGVSVRVLTLASNVGDQSIINRLRIWRGTAELVYECSPSVLSLPSFALKYAAWCQDVNDCKLILTPVSDVMTILVSFGYAGLYMAAGLWVILVYGAICVGLRGNWYSGLAAMLSCYVTICGIFSTFIVQPLVSTIILSVAIILVFNLFLNWKEAGVWKTFWVAQTCAMALTIAIYLVGANAFESRSFMLSVTNADQDAAIVIDCSPRANPLATVVVCHEQFDLIADTREIVRGLVQDGFRVVVLRNPIRPLEVARQLRAAPLGRGVIWTVFGRLNSSWSNLGKLSMEVKSLGLVAIGVPVGIPIWDEGIYSVIGPGSSRSIFMYAKGDRQCDSETACRMLRAHGMLRFCKCEFYFTSNRFLRDFNVEIRNAVGRLQICQN